MQVIHVVVVGSGFSFLDFLDFIASQECDCEKCVARREAEKAEKKPEEQKPEEPTK